MKRWRLTLLVACAALSACGPARRDEPIKGAVRIADPQVARGRAAYMLHCNRCHPGGTAGLGPALNDKPLPAFVVRMQVRAGLGVMPSFGPERISDADLDAIVAYLKMIRRADAKPM